ncbi:hypothetical protein IFM89_008257 [Coptis chinensis]|uniref:Uncharacterized protein n=1 Tax=Coptis chinensis TaxID=261450 RepID=A0A835IAX4_9MAGN|nr:hypothetical protein IFM89_008257 [Coptis chinensis]
MMRKKKKKEVNKKPVRVPGGSSSSSRIRKEILELGFPDDGCEIKNSGGDSAYYENSKAKLDQLSLRVNVSGIGDDFNDNFIYGVAANTVGVKVQKFVGPEVSALLDHYSDMARFGSDVEDLEEDFVVQANVPEEGEGVYKKIYSKFVEEKPRVQRLLDEQFDMLTLREYETESDSELNGSVVAEDESLVDKLNFSLKGHVKDELELDAKYKIPADIVCENEGSKNGEAGESSAKLIRRCAEYGEMCDDDDDEVVLVEESSGKIEVPRIGTHIITLRGKQKLPVDNVKEMKLPVDNVKEARGSRSDKQKKKRHGDESKEEKKERKSVKQQGMESKEEKKQWKVTQF